jgi:hypothetical protein
MALLSVDCNDISDVVGKLSNVLDFEKDLPSNVFIKNNLCFWFFERPIIDYGVLLSELVSISYLMFGSGVYVKFSGDKKASGTCFLFNGVDVSEGVELMGRKFSDFSGGTLGYPICIFNEECNWVALESAYDEFGVIAVDSEKASKEFLDFLNLNFISRAEMLSLEAGGDAMGMDAGALVRSYI